jgi:hypothetical protein
MITLMVHLRGRSRPVPAGSNASRVAHCRSVRSCRLAAASLPLRSARGLRCEVLAWSLEPNTGDLFSYRSPPRHNINAPTKRHLGPRPPGESQQRGGLVVRVNRSSHRIEATRRPPPGPIVVPSVAAARRHDPTDVQWPAPEPRVGPSSRPRRRWDRSADVHPGSGAAGGGIDVEIILATVGVDVGELDPAAGHERAGSGRAL